MNTRTTRLGFLKTIAVGLIAGITSIKSSSAKKPSYRRIEWIKLNDEPVMPGDMWVNKNNDPNNTGQKNAPWHTLQMQSPHESNWGMPANEIPRGNGDYWRPVGLVDVY
jgi:hypothetical protein